MSIFAVLACLGLLQTLFAFSLVKSSWIRLCLSLLVAGTCFAIHPLVLNINFLRFEQFISSDAAVFMIASVIFVESAVKGFFNLNENTTPCQSQHFINRALHNSFTYGSMLVRNTPSIMLAFFLIFSLSYSFHHSETTPFRLLAGGIATSLFLFLTLGSLILSLSFKADKIRTVVFNLLFIQLVLAIALPLLSDGSGSLPTLYDESIHLQSVATGITMLSVTLSGFLFYYFTNKKAHA